MLQRERGCDFEECRVRIPVSYDLANVGQAICSGFFRNHFTVHTNSLAKGDEVRGGEQTTAIPLRSADRIDHCADRSLAVCAGHVDDAGLTKIDMQRVDETPNVFEAEFDPEALKTVKPGQRRLI